ncbi:MAG: hypothetical protein Q7V88_01800 [Actinomycetota bacterium]|nr:hypothetical protein [Actinomycetota bacterium]
MNDITSDNGGQPASPSETMKASIERVLAERASQDQGFITELMLHPDAIIKPLISQSLGDDGEVNLAAVSTAVHIETDRNLHFVVSVAGGDVQGYAMSLANSLNSFGSELAGGDVLSARKTRRKCDVEVTPNCTNPDAGCPTVYDGTRVDCPVGSPTWP